MQTTDRQTDRRDEANSRFCNFGDALKDVLFQLGIEPQFLCHPVQTPPNNNGVTPKGTKQNSELCSDLICPTSKYFLSIFF